MGSLSVELCVVARLTDGFAFGNVSGLKLSLGHSWGVMVAPRLPSLLDVETP